MKPTILISNDDSIFSKGIKAMVEVARQFGKVVVVAPDKPQSAKSHAITLNNVISYRKTDIFGTEVDTYACSGTPADCIKLALNKILDKKPNLILSGINHGANSSVNLIYSGTIAAAVEGALHNIPSIAFSLTTHDENFDLEPAKKYSTEIIAKILETTPKDSLCLNVNIPNVAASAIKGLKICKQTKGAWFEAFDSVKHQHADNPFFLLNGKFINFEPNKEDTDIWALENNYVAIVPIKIDFTDYEMLDKLNF